MISKWKRQNEIGALEAEVAIQRQTVAEQGRKLKELTDWLDKTLKAYTTQDSTWVSIYYLGKKLRFPAALASQKDLQAVLDHLKMKVCDVPLVPSKRVLKKTCEKKSG